MDESQPQNRGEGFAVLLTIIAFSIPWLLLARQLSFFWQVDPQYSYGWAVPLLGVVLFALRWPDRPPAGAVCVKWTAILCVPVALGFLPLRLAQEATPDWSVVNWSLSLFVVAFSLGFLITMGGVRLAQWFFFPCAFILSAVPWPQRLELATTHFLMQKVTVCTVEALGWLAIPAVQQGNFIRLPLGVVGIEDACSGVRSLQGLLMVSLFLGELYRFRWQWRAALVGVGVILALCGNLLRTLFLSVVAAMRGVQAIQIYHDPAGFWIFIFGLTGTWLFANYWRPAPVTVLPRKGNLLHPLPIAITSGLVFCFVLVEVGVEMWFSMHEPLVKPQDWTICWQPELKDFKRIEVPDSTTSILLCSEASGASWTEGDGSFWQVYSLRWAPGKTAPQSARMHRPETCLTANGAVLQEDLGLIPMRAGTLALSFRLYSFDHGGRRMHVFFCLYEQGNRDLTTPGMLQDWSGASRLQRVLTGQRNLGQQVLEIAMVGYTNPAEATEALSRRLPDMIELSAPVRTNDSSPAVQQNPVSLGK